MSRRERQQEQIRIAITREHYARALVLAREHLAEFPDDDIIRAAYAQARQAWEQLPTRRDDPPR